MLDGHVFLCHCSHGLPQFDNSIGRRARVHRALLALSLTGTSFARGTEVHFAGVSRTNSRYRHPRVEIGN